VRPASLRGLSPDHTLVLVNGKRRHGSALVHLSGTVGKGSSNVDLNAIPMTAIKRIEILRDLRLGAFDVLIGINLLREGLDIPECGLVAILDADKEGFLRSETSLIQTIGRAARNAEGRVIMYADRITGSMERALAETDRRRARQVDYNVKHGITPETIKKNVGDVLSGLYEGDVDMLRVTAKLEKPMVGANLQAHLDGLRTEMRKAAENLEFEEAARIRDEVKRLEAVELAIADDPLARQSAIDAASEAAV